MMVHSEPSIRVMVVDDSAVMRGLWSRMIEAEPDMHVVASAANGRAALELLRHKTADIILLDVEMPEMDGLSALPRILEAQPAARVIMASSLTQAGATVTVRALALGAADYIGKPTAGSVVGAAAAVGAELVAKIRALGRSAQRQRAPARRSAPPTAARAGLAGAPNPRPLHTGDAVRLLVIAASTGGPNALSRLFQELPHELSLPILIVQHMPPHFTAVLAERIRRESGHDCREAQDGELLRAGRVYMAPGDYHLTLASAGGETMLRLDRGEPVNYCRPSADPTLRSAAALYGAGMLAVVLTGMGEDGLNGCREVVARRGRVLVQDEASSVVWGMPGAVAHAGLASAVLPLEQIAPQLARVCSVLA